MQIEFEENGFVRVLGDELRDRFTMQRLVPVYSIQKIILARLFGGNVVAWSFYTGLVTAFTAGVLIHFFRLCHGHHIGVGSFCINDCCRRAIGRLVSPVARRGNRHANAVHRIGANDVANSHTEISIRDIVPPVYHGGNAF